MRGLYLASFVFVIFIIGVSLLIVNNLEREVVTGRVTSTGTVSFTQAGSAGLSLSDEGIAFGSGYYNSSLCSLGYGVLNSNTSKACWTNTTTYLDSEDLHHLVNSGTVPVNITLSANLSDAEELFCGSALGCSASTSAGILVKSVDNESNSCYGLTNGFENVSTATGNATVGICDYMDYMDSNDSIQVYVELHVPSDVSAGSKILYFNYEAVAR